MVLQFVVDFDGPHAAQRHQLKELEYSLFNGTETEPFFKHNIPLAGHSLPATITVQPGIVYPAAPATTGGGI